MVERRVGSRSMAHRTASELDSAWRGGRFVRADRRVVLAHRRLLDGRAGRDGVPLRSAHHVARSGRRPGPEVPAASGTQSLGAGRRPVVAKWRDRWHPARRAAEQRAPRRRARPSGRAGEPNGVDGRPRAPHSGDRSVPGRARPGPHPRRGGTRRVRAHRVSSPGHSRPAVAIVLRSCRGDQGPSSLVPAGSRWRTIGRRFDGWDSRRAGVPGKG